jgi:hypothetical protein
MDVHSESTAAFVCYFVLRKGTCGIISLIIVTFSIFLLRCCLFSVIAFNELWFYDFYTLIGVNMEQNGFKSLPQWNELAGTDENHVTPQATQFYLAKILNKENISKII